QSLPAAPPGPTDTPRRRPVPAPRGDRKGGGGGRRPGGAAGEWRPRGELRQSAPPGPPEPVEPVPLRRSEQGVVDDWYRYIREGVEPGISGRHNLETLAVCEMVLRSAAQRRAIERSELAVDH